jgi:hypothetical protein
MSSDTVEVVSVLTERAKRSALLKRTALLKAVLFLPMEPYRGTGKQYHILKVLRNSLLILAHLSKNGKERAIHPLS